MKIGIRSLGFYRARRRRSREREKKRVLGGFVLLDDESSQNNTDPLPLRSNRRGKWCSPGKYGAHIEFPIKRLLRWKREDGPN